MKRPLIFITNDDGFDSVGIAKLAAVAKEFGDVLIGAPATAQSGKSSALTVNSPLEAQKVDSIEGCETYAITGTPVDCVKVSLHAVLDRKPDLLLSGINHGSNAAVNNIYSGTMGAAMEGCLVGIPSIGFSLLDHSPKADFEPILPLVREIISKVLTNGLPDGICLNVNFPAHCTPSGIKTVRAALGHWTEEYADYSTPHGKPFYWLTGKFHNDEPDDPDTDEYWLARQYATVVPIRPDQTALDQVTSIRSMLER